MKVKDLMYRKLFSVTSGTSAFDAAKTMVDNEVGSFLVKKNKEYIGIVTEGDYVIKIITEQKDPKKVLVEEIMSYPFIMIDEDGDVLEAAELMTKYNIKRLIVVNKGKIVGIISKRIVARNLRRLIEEHHR